MLAGPWQPRSLMWESSTAGVASVISAVETLPVTKPAFWACSRIVGRLLSSMSVEMRPFEVLDPVAQAVPVAAESGT